MLAVPRENALIIVDHSRLSEDIEFIFTRRVVVLPRSGRSIDVWEPRQLRQPTR